MKTVKHLLAFLMTILLAVFLCGCSQSAKDHAEKAIKKDLDLLKNLDSETTMQYISYQELFPDSDWLHPTEWMVWSELPPNS